MAKTAITPQEALDQARRDLDTALRTGHGTAEARERLAQAETALAQHQQTATRTDAEVRRDHAQRVGIAVTSMVETEQNVIAAELAAVLPGFPVAVNIAPDAARWLIEAREAQAETAAQREALTDELATLQSRIVDLEAERSQIAARRHERNPEDIGRLGFIDLDLADLRGMAGQIQAKIAALPHHDMADLTRRWNEAVRVGRANARLSVAAELERRLLFVAQALKVDSGGNTRHRYTPSHELSTACRYGVF